jgi:flagellar hook-associated protein 2
MESIPSIVTALGGGSGIDMAALAQNLATAQFQLRSARLTTRAETLDRQISAASALKSQMLQFASALGERVRTGDLAPQPSLGNPSVAVAKLASGSAPSGSYSLEVLALAAPQTIASADFVAGTTPVGAGSLTLRFGALAGAVFTEDLAHTAVTIDIASGATLADIASAINAKGAGVTAYVANTTTGTKLVLKGSEGAANGFVLDATETPGEEGLAALAWNPVSGDPARLLAGASSASFKLDGLTMTSASNSAADVVPGLSLTLTGTNIGAPTLIRFSDPSAAIASVMQDLTTALNEVVTALSAATSATTGDLNRDSGARALRRELSALAGSVIMPGAAAGAPRTLADLGLATTRDGSFRLDTTRLAAALKADSKGAAAFFTPGLYGVYASLDRIARNAAAAGNPGSLAGSVTRFTAQQGRVTLEQSKLAEAQEKLRAQLTSRFATSESRVGASRSTLSFLQNQIDAWNSGGN